MLGCAILSQYTESEVSHYKQMNGCITLAEFLTMHDKKGDIFSVLWPFHDGFLDMNPGYFGISAKCCHKVGHKFGHKFCH